MKRIEAGDSAMVFARDAQGHYAVVAEYPENEDADAPMVFDEDAVKMLLVTQNEAGCYLITRRSARLVLSRWSPMQAAHFATNGTLVGTILDDVRVGIVAALYTCDEQGAAVEVRIAGAQRTREAGCLIAAIMDRAGCNEQTVSAFLPETATLGSNVGEA